jgi:preprotein translocase subunit Sss1
MVNLPVDFNVGGILGKSMFWLGYSLLFCLIIGVIGFVIYITTFKYKVTILERRGSGKTNAEGKETHFIGKIIKDRAREIKQDGILKLKLLKSKKSIEPPGYENIYPNNQVFLYKVGPEHFVPVAFKCGNPSASFQPLPQNIRYWEQLEIQQGAEDYQKKSAWDKYSPVLIMGGTVLFCLILVGVTIYYTYQYHQGALAQTGGLVDALKGTAESFGGTAPQ